jgi:hypothetical protein
VHNCPEELTEEVIRRELNFTFECISVLALNESAWNYLRGLLKFHPGCRDEILAR